MPLWLAACIFIAFLVLAVVGIIVIFNLLFSGKNIEIEAEKSLSVAYDAAKNLLSGGKIL